MIAALTVKNMIGFIDGSIPCPSEHFSLFRSRLRSRRLDDSTLQILEFVSVSKDVKSLIEAKSRLKELLRFESLSIIRETVEKTDDQKLLVLEFLVRAFALVGDTESCLALRYEALSFREMKSSNQKWLQVSHVEWLNFAEHSMHSGFISIAIKALTSEYLKKKVTERNRKDSSFCTRTPFTASTLFRSGIRNHNARKLQEYQGLPEFPSESYNLQFGDRS
ncbi:uncharacterized protein LOC111022017 isoform X2 [Momordica charantia]|uniref:Uncharacterized protein LOC111022017 isoform X2 n=1 Tax=Momordica charantia TaxID=3673 RepID=A0A6J1DPZ7_MOMCH|nr:uncharacterized protein LOC111022017 isoform X2 [Momordica charantia]